MASIPSTQKGVIISNTGGPEVLEYKTDLPVPALVDGQILVKNDAIGVNYVDVYIRSGLYPPPQLPYIIGQEAEGTIVKTGGGNLYGLKEGDRVVWMSRGAYAQYTGLSARDAIKIPDGIPPNVAAGAILQGLTALTFIREAHPIKKGDWALVHAAAGGTGLWLTQILKAIGVHVIGTASTQEKIDVARKAGAEHAINYSREDVQQKVAEITQGRGVDAVYDGVGKDTFDVSVNVLARKGTLVSFGNASGVPGPVNINKLMGKNVRLVRPILAPYIATREEYEAYTQELFDFILKGLETKITKVYPLSDAAQSHKDLEGRKTTGKLLLDPSK
ncbi:hypothetical protein M426DRAFT_316805 [Hypoxylon sp. CI-4A]|nr:hypothetical protein M426DRAFT_316805 [Hypoxylon sp. CI-4A]